MRWETVFAEARAGGRGRGERGSEDTWGWSRHRRGMRGLEPLRSSPAAGPGLTWRLFLAQSGDSLGFLRDSGHTPVPRPVLGVLGGTLS